jgi:TolB-like protein/tetratricopeptide (TPR) repeat protein
MATVYLARDLRHERDVALKVLRPELAATMGPDRFLQEVRVTANLQHPHILPLFDSGEADGFLYYVMPYLEGESLRERVAREGELPVTQAVRILREVVDALAAAHQQGVVHRDIKPDNVMLSGRHAVVTDFGVAKAVSEATGRHQLTTKGVALGTPAYMAPEQAAANEHIDHRADIYAVGAMGYELLAGRPPFSGLTAQQILAAHVTEVPRPVTELRESVPEGLGEVLMRCLEKKPADRWQSAEELLRQLELFATPSTGVTPTQTTPTAGVATGKGDLPLWLKIGAPAALAAIALFVWLGTQGPATGIGEPSDAAASASEDTERLVVLPLENLTDNPELDIRGSLAADQIARSIDQPKPIPVVPSSTVRDTYRQLGEDASTEEVARAVNATHAMAGTISSTGSQIRMEIELIDVRTGERLRAFEPVAGPADSVEVLMGRLTVMATAGAVAHLAPDSPSWMANVSLPVSLEAYELYERQLDLFCERKYAESVEVGNEALAGSPGYIPPLNLVGVALSNLRREREADSVYALLGGVRDQMDTGDRLLYDWMIGSRTGNPTLSTRAAEDGFRLDPAGWGVNAMLTAYRTNRMTDAVERYYAAARPGGCPWLGAWTQGATAFHVLERYEEELAVAREGLQYWPDHMELMDIEIRAFVGMGRLDAVDSVLAVMANLPAAPEYDPALRPVWAARELWAHGYETEAEKMFSDAIEHFPSRTTSTTTYNLGRAHYYARRWSEAAEAFRQLSPESSGNLNYIGFYGVTLAKLGDRDGAEVMIELAGTFGGSHHRGLHLLAQARITAALGERDEAIRRLQDAFANGGAYGIWIHVDPALDDLRGYPPFESLVRPR